MDAAVICTLIAQADAAGTLRTVNRQPLETLEVRFEVPGFRARDTRPRAFERDRTVVARVTAASTTGSSPSTRADDPPRRVIQEVRSLGAQWHAAFHAGSARLGVSSNTLRRDNRDGSQGRALSG